MENTISTASKEIGVTSDINGSVNPRVLDYFKKIGAAYLPGYDEVWCAAFAGFVLETCGVKSTRALNARSYLNWGIPVTTPTQGDIVVFWRDSVSSSNGHVSFFHHQVGNTIYCLGGNQGAGVVDIEAYPVSRVLGYRTNKLPTPVTPVIINEPIISNTNKSMEASSVKFVKFFDSVTHTVKTYFTAEKTVDSGEATFEQTTPKQAVAEGTVEEFIFWDNKPVGLGTGSEQTTQ